MLDIWKCFSGHVESTMSHYAMLLLASVPVMLFCLFRQYGITVVLGVGTIFMGTVSEMGVAVAQGVLSGMVGVLIRAHLPRLGGMSKTKLSSL